MEDNKTTTIEKPSIKKEEFKIMIPPELADMRSKASDQEMLLTLNELIVHRILNGTALSKHKHLKTWPGVLVENDSRVKLTVIYNASEMDGNEAEDYIYNKDFSSDKVIIVKRESVANFK